MTEIDKIRMSSPAKLIKIMKKIKPTRIWIDGKCFDIPKNAHNVTHHNEINLLEEYKIHYDINIINDLYHSSFRVPSIYYEKLKMLPNFAIKDLEEHTNAEISIPYSDGDENVVISSKNIENVIVARSKLHSLFSLIRDSQNVLQFLTIPVLNQDIKSKFNDFKNAILTGEEIEGMHESIFQKPERLHLTIGVLTLLDDVETTEAIRVLDECKEKVIKPMISQHGPLKVKVCGLECMNDDYSKVNILYANAKIYVQNGSDILQDILNSIAKHFHEKGLICQYQENVKIHVTLMNTKYRKAEDRKRKWKDKKKTFNATTIIDTFKDFEFGECSINEVHLSWISKIDDNGFYKPLAIITI